MKTIKELLHDADPLRHEPTISSAQRDACRQAVVAAAGAASPGGVNARFRFARLSALSVAVVVILLLGWRVWPRMGSETHASVRFEVRLAEDTPGPGLREAKVSGDDRSIYLHEEIVVGNGDIARAEIAPDENARPFAVSVHLTPDGGRKMRDATQSHVGRPLAILVDDEVVMAPVVKSIISDAGQITGLSKELAERIVNGLY